MGPIRPGGLVDSMGRPAQVQGAQDIWSTLRALTHGTESPGTAGRPCSLLVHGPSCSDQLVDTAGPRTRARDVLGSR